MSPEVWIRFLGCAAYDDETVATRASMILDVAERRHWERILAPAARRDYLAAHLLRRWMLSALTGIDPAAFRFRASAAGRPVIVRPHDGRRFRASLSHADGIAICAITEGLAVGADVESRRNLGGDLPDIAALIAGRAACRGLSDLPPGERSERFLRLWTTHEAIAKARGVGLGAAAARTLPARSEWQVACWRLTWDHVAAVVVRRPAIGHPVSLRIEGDVVATCA